MDNPPKNHHYVPICYLSEFTDHQKKMWKKSRKGKKVIQCTPSQVCYEKDLYTIRKESTLKINNLSDKYYVEKQSFKKHESQYPKTISKIVSNPIRPNVIDKNDYFLFLETLFGIKRRHPLWKHFLAESFIRNEPSDFDKERFRNEIFKICEAVGEEENIDEYVDEFFSKVIYDRDRLNDVYLSSFWASANDSFIAEVSKDLYQYKQFILRAPIGIQFIASDNPGFVRNGDLVRSFGGFGEPFHYYFPLSPSACLLIDSTLLESELAIQKTIYPKIIDRRLIADINQITYRFCRDKVFANSSDILRNL